MAQLHLQTYLRAFPHRGPETLKEELGIDYRIKDGKVIFTYNQFDSPKTNPIVRECRGIILYEGSWDICCYPFERFFNHGESGADDIQHLEDAYVFPKLDGTMCNLYWDRNDKKWHVSTRSMIDAEGPVGDVNLNLGTFAELFHEAASKTRILSRLQRVEDIDINSGITLTFELTGPLNRIVTRYDESKITLLTMRRNDSGKEASLETCKRFAKEFDVAIIEPIKMTNWEELLKMQGLADTDEGFVVCKEAKEGSHKRIKVKNPAYLSIARLVESPSEKHFLDLIQRGSADEFLAYYPEYKDHIDKLQVGVKVLSQRLRDDYLSIHTIEDRKSFALEATRKMFPGMMFGMRDKKVTCLAADLLLMPTRDLLEMIHRVNTEV